MRFRWQFSDDVDHYQWSEWHTDGKDCEACCCGAPHGSEHQEQADFDDPDGGWYSGHTVFDIEDPEDWVIWERE